jgi:mRNA interferase MazF
VLSPAAYNGRVGLAVLCPVTRQVKGYPFEVEIPDGLNVEGVILADQVKNLEWRARRAELACQLPHETIAELLRKLNTLLTE